MFFQKLRSQMKWVIIVVVIAFGLGVLYLGGGSLMAPDQVAQAVARVNGDEISEFELNQAFLNYVNFSRQMGQPISRAQEEELRFTVLQELVDRRLMLQAAKRERIRVDEALVSDEIAQIKESLGSEYQAILRREGLTERVLRDSIREGLMIDAVREAKSSVSLTDEEVRRAYEEENERRAVRHILVEPQLVDGELDWDGALAKAEELLARLRQGEDFAELAQEHSDDPGSRADGGSIGLVGRNDPLVPEFLARTFTLAVGEVSEPVRTQYGYHLIQVTEESTVESAPFEEVADAFRSQLEQRRGAEQYREWIEKERESADIALFDPQLRAYQLVRAGRLDQAIDQYQEAIAARPNDPYLYYRLGLAFEQVGADDEALDAYRNAAELGVTDAFLWFVVGSALWDMDLPEEAKDAYLKASEYSLGNAQIHQILAQVFEEMGYPELAEAERERLDQLQAQFFEELMRQQEFLQQEQELQRQIEEARRAAEGEEAAASGSDGDEAEGEAAGADSSDAAE